VIRALARCVAESWLEVRIEWAYWRLCLARERRARRRFAAQITGLVSRRSAGRIARMEHRRGLT